MIAYNICYSTCLGSLKELFKEVEVSHLERLKYRLSDAIREGSMVTEKAKGWGEGESACALHAAVIAAEARGYGV